jgi:hypothetical protein
VPRLGPYSGHLLISADGQHVSREELLSIDGLAFVAEFTEGSYQWEHYRLESTTPMMREWVAGGEPATTFAYDILARRSVRRVLIAAEGKDVGDFLKSRLTKMRLHSGRKRAVRIDTHGLVADLVRSPTVYTVSVAHAEVTPFGGALKSCAFYGDDIGSADWFKNSLGLLYVYRCGLRSVERGEEVLKVGRYGSVAFQYRGPSSLKDVEDALGFIREAGHMLETWSEDTTAEDGEHYAQERSA